MVFLEESLNKLTDNPVILFSFPVDPQLGYNCLSVGDDSSLKAIIPAKELTQVKSGVTYTGNSLVNLNKLSPVSGKSSFFNSVANFEKNRIMVNSVGNLDYWDFGTAQRYWLTMKRIINLYKTTSTHPFLRFLVNARAIKSWKINLNTLSYHARGVGVIHLGHHEDLTQSKELISLTDHGFGEIHGPEIIFNETKEKINL